MTHSLLSDCRVPEFCKHYELQAFRLRVLCVLELLQGGLVSGLEQGLCVSHRLEDD
jgi:hypothetical protein